MGWRCLAAPMCFEYFYCSGRFPNWPSWLIAFTPNLCSGFFNRLPQTGDRGVCLKQQLQDKLIEHKQYIDKHGQDMPEILNWTWGTNE